MTGVPANGERVLDNFFHKVMSFNPDRTDPVLGETQHTLAMTKQDAQQAEDLKDLQIPPEKKVV
ncbi:hypothetical protein ACHAPX_006070 [Trichoderma viride]